ncbi:PHB depolymerase family esterase [Marinobacter sp. F3R08]|uniref:extracellular catalytic domain type 1 short-chain-length polyhydroxyalkanoate depolymerase n=1 Tax=Marinobacter sp. F3R08 TaxID=2841559 RepID=UPI001C08B737|nr:PHB depolymerase family esterase [Marinobacter sp. F3R08]MBU2953724.1 PHB depolymerase family esterase [Marinobacter sp. F3R08]
MKQIFLPLQSGAGLSVLLLAALLILPVMPTTAGQTYSYSQPQQSYNQSRTRNYKVYVPDNLTSPAPMVMALHGCKQTNDDVLNDWGLTAAADTYGFILVAPFITSYDGMRNENCWGFWFDHHRHEGAGETEDLHQIGVQVEADYNIDPNRRFITGLSSGGAMTAVAAITHNEYWAAAAAAAGLPYGEDAASVSLSGQCPGSASFHSVSQVVSDMQGELDDSYPIPMMLLHNENDCTVLKEAADNIRDAHLQVFGATAYDTPAEAQASSTACGPYYQNNYSCEHVRYTEDATMGTRSLVETVYLDGPLSTPNTQDTNHGHYWVGGSNGNNGKWSVKVGPSYPDIIWNFFDRHSRDGSQPEGFPVITLIGNNPMNVAINSTFTDPGATANDAEDGSITVTGDCSNVDTSTVGSYTCMYSATDSDTNTTTRQRDVLVYDPNAPTETCEQAISSPSAHISAGRAYAGGAYNYRTFASGDDVDIGASYDTWSNVTLYEGDPGLWYSAEPAACSGSGGGGDGGGEPAACQDWNDTNLNHDNAGRAYYAGGYYSTGGNDYLGSVSGIYTWVKETQDGIFEAGQCD